MNYQDAIANVLSLFDSERTRVDGPRQKAIYNLGRMEEFLDRAGNPHRRVPTVHIAGTKGKGSTAALCDSAFRAAGLSTGFYSSPHLHTFRERLRRNCEPVSEEQFAGVVADLWPLRNVDGQDTVTLFEFLTAMGFHCFAQAGADVQTIEVGLGGGWTRLTWWTPRFASSPRSAWTMRISWETPSAKLPLTRPASLNPGRPP